MSRKAEAGEGGAAVAEAEAALDGKMEAEVGEHQITVGPSKKAEPKKAPVAGVITINQLKLQTMIFGVKSLSPLIMNQWSEKAKGMMRDAQTGVADANPKKREKKVPENDFKASYYTLPKNVRIFAEVPDLYSPFSERFGFKACAFKAASVNACRLVDGISMVMAKQMFHVLGEFVEIIAPPPVMREDMVRLASGVADIRYRAEFDPWAALLPIRYNAEVCSQQQLANLLNLAGFSCGVGEWRPSAPKSCTGSYGMFEVCPPDEVFAFAKSIGWKAKK
jgi:hypothetical protein